MQWIWILRDSYQLKCSISKNQDQSQYLLLMNESWRSITENHIIRWFFSASRGYHPYIKVHNDGSHEPSCFLLHSHHWWMISDQIFLQSHSWVFSWWHPLPYQRLKPSIYKMAYSGLELFDVSSHFQIGSATDVAEERREGIIIDVALWVFWMFL